MSIIQSNHNEIRYLKRKNLDSEARIIGNYYCDLINLYGIDCIYHKLNTTEYNDFKKIIDRNLILKQAYGYDVTPEYHVSVDMITYAQIDLDIFLLNKFGINPNTDINLFFDATSFACALAPRVGVLKEYKIREKEIICEVPEMTDEYVYYGNNMYFLSDDTFPFNLGLGYTEYYDTVDGTLSGKFRATISSYSVDEENIIICRPFEHTDFNIRFPVNGDLYKSLLHKIANDDYLETLLYLKYKVLKVKIGKLKAKLIKYNNLNTLKDIKIAVDYIFRFLRWNDKYDFSQYSIERIIDTKNIIKAINLIEQQLGIPILKFVSGRNIKDEILNIYNIIDDFDIIMPMYKYILKGNLYGSVLFYDLNEIGKYAEKIHPAVGDIVEIDFPDENNREQYDITECVDKDLSESGLNPLLHKYIWKCKARRHVNSYENNDIPVTEADNRIDEKKKFDQIVYDEVADAVTKHDHISDDASPYEDAVYGGYDNVVHEHDHMKPNDEYHEKFEFIDDGSAITLIEFGCGTKLVTTGYELLFITSAGDAYQIATSINGIQANYAYVEQNLRYLKATDSLIVFINAEGDPTSIIVDIESTNNELEICLNSLQDKTLDDGQPINEHKDNFYKFKGTKTYLWSFDDHLYAKLQSNKQLYKIF